MDKVKNAVELVVRFVKDRIAWLKSLRKGDDPQP